MKICLNTHNLASGMTIDEIIAACKAAGVYGVEFSIGYGHAHGVEFETPKPELITIRDKILDAGLETVSIASDCRFDSESEEERSRNLDLAKKGVDIAATMKAGLFRFVGNDMPKRTMRDVFLPRMAGVMGELADYGAPGGVTALLQIHGTLSRAPDVAEIARLCGRRNSGLVYNCDCGDVIDGSVDAYLDRVGGFIRHVHMHCMLLNYPYQKMFAILKRIGYNGFYSIVVDDPSSEREKFIAYYARLANALYDNA
jgi:sugar phosphate isomerase/epimerase